MKTIDANGLETAFSYVDADSDGQARELSLITDPVGRTFTYSYSGGQLSSLTDFQGRQFDFTYDAEGRVTSVTAPDPDGTGGATAPTLNLSYDPTTSLLTSMTDAENNTTSVNYGSDLRIRSITYPGNVTENYDPVQIQGLDEFVLLSSVVGTVASAGGETSTVRTDSFGYVIESTDPRGNTTTYERDRNGQVIRSTNALGHSVSYEYDDHGRKLSATYDDSTSETWTYDDNNHLLHEPLTYTNRLGNVWTYTYDVNGNVLSETDPLSNTMSYVYNSMGLVTTLTEPDPDGSGPLSAPMTNYTYDSFGQLTRITFADGSFRDYTYDAAGNQTSETDELGRVTNYLYDDLGRMIQMTLPDPDGSGTASAPVYQYEYNGAGQLTSETDPLGNVTTYQYDGRGRLLTLTLPDPDAAGPQAAPVLNYTYDADGNLLTETDALGNVTTYTYDAVGNVIETELPDPDGSGNLSAPVFTSTYDALNRLLTETDPLGNTTAYTYDANGNLASITDPLNRTTSFGYDALGRRTSVTNALSQQTIYSYSPLGDLLSVTDPLGRTTTYVYDNLGRQIQVTLPDPDGAGGQSAPVVQYTYDGVGNLLSETDPLGNTTNYSYDSVGNLTQMTLPDPDGPGGVPAPVWQYVYDDLNRRIREIDPLQYQTVYAFDAVGNLTSTTLPDPDGAGGASVPVWQYAYDNLGRRISETDPLGQSRSFSYDVAGNLLAETDRLGNTTSYTYDNLGRATHMTLPDPDGAGGQPSPVWHYVYDAAGRTISVIDPLGGSVDTTYDKMGRPLTVTDPLGRAATYGYDALGRRTSSTDPLGNTTVYTYDAVGNLRTVTGPDPDGGGPLPAPGTTSSYDNLDRVVRVTNPQGESTDFTYDVAGNLLTETDALGNVTSYSYDGLYRLTSTTRPDPDGGGSQIAAVTQYEYDLLGRQTAVIDPLNNRTEFVFDSLGRLMSQTDAESGTTTFGYDALGNRTSLTDPIGNTTTWVYNDEQQVLSETNELNDSRTYVYDDLGRLISRTDRRGRVREFDYDALGRTVEERWYASGGSTAVDTLTWTYDATSQLTSAADGDSSYDYTYDSGGRLTSVDNLGTSDMPRIIQNYGYDNLGRRTTANASIDGTADFQNSYNYDSAGRMTRVTQVDGAASGGSVVSDKRVDIIYDDLGRFQTINRYESTSASTLVASTDFVFDDASRLETITHARNAELLAEYDRDYDTAGRVTEQTIERGDRVLGGSVWPFIPDDLLVGDFNDDGKDDVAAYYNSSTNTGEIWVSLSIGDGDFAPAVQWNSAALPHRSGWTELLTGDYNGDGRTDIAGFSDSDTWYVMLSLPATSPDPEQFGSLIASTPWGSSDWLGSMTADLDNDGLDDVLAMSDGGNWYIGLNNGDATFAYTQSGNWAAQVSSGADWVGQFNGNFDSSVTDINNDDYPDVIAMSDGGDWYVGLNDGTGQFNYALSGDWSGVGGDWIGRFVGDFNGDGVDDVAGFSDSGNWYVGLNDGNGNVGTNAHWDTWGTPTAWTAEHLYTGDFNGDGWDDVFGLNTSTNTWTTGRAVDTDSDGIADAFSTTTNVFPAMSSLMGTTVGDFDGDGLIDLAEFSSSGSTEFPWQVSRPGYDPDGRHSQYTYDDTNQLTAANHEGFADEDYAFDANGNRTGTSITVGPNNLLYSDGTHNFLYDGENNRTRKTTIATGDYVDYTYDHRNQLIAVSFHTSNGTPTKNVEFDYDVQNRLIRQRVDETGDGTFDRGLKFVYDHAGKTDPATGVPLDDIVLVFDDTGSLTNRYLHGPGIDQVFADEDAVGDILWSLADHQGTVRGIADYDATEGETNVVNHLDYDSFGNLIGESNPAQTPLFRYTGRYYDTDAEIQWNNARWYDPETGNWLTQDPIGFSAGDANLSRYVGNSAVNQVDPSGFEAMGHHYIAKNNVLGKLPGLSDDVIDFVWGYTSHPTKPGTHTFDAAHRAYDKHILEKFKLKFMNDGVWDVDALGKLTPDDFKGYIDNISTGRNPFTGHVDEAIDKYIKESIDPNVVKKGISCTADDAIQRGRKFQLDEARKRLRKAKGANTKKKWADKVDDLTKHLDDPSPWLDDVTKRSIDAVEKGAKESLEKGAKEAMEKAAEEAAEKASKRIGSKILKVIPVLGFFWTGKCYADDVRDKGIVGGTVNSGMDALPVVGNGKAFFEIISGRDSFLTKEEIDRRFKLYDDYWKTHSPNSGAHRSIGETWR